MKRILYPIRDTVHPEWLHRMRKLTRTSHSEIERATGIPKRRQIVIESGVTQETEFSPGTLLAWKNLLSERARMIGQEAEP